jgi:hypothetical protein
LRACVTGAIEKKTEAVAPSSMSSSSSTRQSNINSAGGNRDDTRSRNVRERQQRDTLSSGRYSSKDLKEEKLVINSNIKLEPLKKRDTQEEEEPIPLLPPPPGTKASTTTTTSVSSTSQQTNTSLNLNSPFVAP